MAEAIPMIMCDTDVLIELYKNNPQVVQELRRIGHEQLAISPVTEAELYFGALNKQELEKIKRNLALIRHFPFDAAVSNMFLRLMEAYSLSHKLSLPDALIACTAMVHDLELYTLNAKDFRFISSLKLHQPFCY
jgi:tRNA(fMet)-specific endonuclease VapC